jgi:hypothetical protein
MRTPTWTLPHPAPRLHRGVALQARADSTNTCLPQTLLSVVPDCAVSCIASFASSNYPGATCANTTDINFLCTQPNTSGLTIGEGSVQCVVSFCTGQDQLNLDVYNVCNAVPNAQPRTARTITATILGSSTSMASTMTTLPPSIGVPSSTEDVSTIVMATDSSMWIPMPTSSISTVASASAPSSTATSTPGSAPTMTGAMASADRASSRSGLTTPQIAGIAVGGFAAAVIVFGLLFLALWMRRRRQDRRRSQRRSRLVEQTPPSDYQTPPGKGSPAFSNMESSLSAPTSNGRFYSAPAPMEDKRRSFWRKSIKPEEIGVAVSPKMPGEQSPPHSASSEQSFSLLLPAIPAAALRPAPLDLEAGRDRRRIEPRPFSQATIFDEEPEKMMQEPERIFVDDQPFILEKPPVAKRPRGPPPNLRLPAVPESPPRNASDARIPLTPTYDNGNIPMASPPRSVRSPDSSQGSVSIAERLPPSSFNPGRNVLRKEPPKLGFKSISPPPTEPVLQARSATQLVQTPAAGASVGMASNPRPGLLKRSSTTSIYTDIEEDTTPEELNKQLEAKPPAISPSLPGLDLGQRSPIKDLRYPQIPRSAAVSRQAERPAQLRPSPTISSPPAPNRLALPPPRPRRDELVRNQASFMATDTTSSDGYMSDSTIEFPVPPTTKSRAASLVQLRNNLSQGNKGRAAPAPAKQFFADEEASSQTRTINVAIPQRSPSSKARLTPSKSSTGDLYLTVEI